MANWAPFLGGLRWKELDLDLGSMFVGLWVWWVVCGHGLDETHGKWGAVLGL